MGSLASVESSLARILEEPVLLVAAVILVGGLVYTIAKKVLKIALVFAIGMIALSGYFAWTGQEPPSALRKIQAGAGRQLERGVEAGKRKAKQASDSIAREVRDATKEAVDETARELGVKN